ncbi:MAG: hypothetical protein AAFR89_10525 [Cyanobacteria bacterium J06633_1]
MVVGTIQSIILAIALGNYLPGRSLFVGSTHRLPINQMLRIV